MVVLPFDRTLFLQIGGLNLKLPDNFDIAHYEATYSDDDTPIERIVTEVTERGYLTKSDLIEVSRWKSKERNVGRVKKNSDNFVEEITRAALCLDTPEPERVSGLCRLHGVAWATASAILHWFHKDPYPIWDRPASEAIEFEKSQYKNDFERWDAYMSFCRNVAAQKGVDMRTLDRALWQYSDSKKT